MYRITVKRYPDNDELTLFDEEFVEEDMQILSPKLRLEDNDPGELDFTIPPSHRYANTKNAYGKLIGESRNDTIIVYKNHAWYWEGRPTESKSNFYNERSVHCEGCLSYFSDTVQPLKNYRFASISNSINDFLKEIVNNHNNTLNAMEDASLSFANRKIYIENESIIDVKPTDISTFSRTTNFETTLETINKRLISKYGGHIRVRRSPKTGRLILDYMKDYLDVSSQKVEFGKNLLDYNKSYTFSESATVIIPRGDRQEKDDPFFRTDPAYKDIEQHADLSWLHTNPATGLPDANPRLYMSDEILREKGYLEKTVSFENVVAKIGKGYSSTTGWSSITAYRSATTVLTPTDRRYPTAYLFALQILGKNYLQNVQFDELKLELSIFDLGRLGLNAPEKLNLLERVVCSSAPNGMINKIFPITKMEIDLASVADTTITLGSDEHSKKSISATTGSLSYKVEEPDKDYSTYYLELLESAKATASSIMTRGTTGYISIFQQDINSETRYSDSIVISTEKLTPTEIANLPAKKDIPSYLKTAHPALKFWWWNVDGLAYYDLSKSTEMVKMAMTSDGKIVADEITSKYLKSYTIEGASLMGEGVVSY